MRERNVFEEDPSGSGGDGASGQVEKEKDNLKWPAGEGWKPL